MYNQSLDVLCPVYYSRPPHIDIRRSAANVRKNESAGDVPKLIPRPSLPPAPLRGLSRDFDLPSLSLSLSPTPRLYIRPVSNVVDNVSFLSLGEGRKACGENRGFSSAYARRRGHGYGLAGRRGGIRILSSLSSMHRELFCQTIEANRVRRAVAVNRSPNVVRHGRRQGGRAAAAAEERERHVQLARQRCD